jgi:hypothetical protein
LIDGTGPEPRRIRTFLVVGAALAAASASCGGGRVVVGNEEARSTTTSTSTCAHIPHDEGGCGLTFEEQRRLNLRYADRIDFAGDVTSARAVADEVRVALAPLADRRPAPAVEDVRAALAPWTPGVEVSDKAVRRAGTAFGVPVDGGCVFGSIYEGELEVEIGGYINDGGCLGVYAH